MCHNYNKYWYNVSVLQFLSVQTYHTFTFLGNFLVADAGLVKDLQCGQELFHFLCRVVDHHSKPVNEVQIMQFSTFFFAFSNQHSWEHSPEFYNPHYNAL